MGYGESFQYYSCSWHGEFGKGYKVMGMGMRLHWEGSRFSGQGSRSKDSWDLSQLS